MTEGRNREIRRILAAWATRCCNAARIALGPLRLGNLAAGETRRLTGAEIQQLRALRAPDDQQDGDTASRRRLGAVRAGQRPVPGIRRRRRSVPHVANTNRARRQSAAHSVRNGRGSANSRVCPGRTRDPKTGVVLDYDRPPSTGATTALPETFVREEKTTLMSNPLHAAHYADTASHCQVAIDDNVRVRTIRFASACAVTKSLGACFPASS